MLIKFKTLSLGLLLTFAASSFLYAGNPVVPGTGRWVQQVGDDFEDPNWSYIFRGPKSTENIDDQRRQPAGSSANGRFYEGIKRGHPDIVKRVPAPQGGLKGSTHALLLKSLRTGIPGSPSYKLQQDDFIVNTHTRVGMIPVSKSPSCVTRVFLPPVEEWENRTGPHFAMRLSVTTTVTEMKKQFFRQVPTKKTETYWPGIFIEFVSKDGNKNKHDYAYLRIRGNNRGYDYRSKPIKTTGWWTLGMSVSSDGQIHYFAKPGVEELTMADHLASEFAYSFRAEHFKTFFYNVCNGDDGRTWSSDWIIDDPKLYVVD